VGFFDIFKSGKKDGSKKTNAADKWAGSATDKRAQAYDRQEAINELVKLGSKEAVAVLLKRFTFVVDPSITDQEEKDSAFHGIIQAGPEALEPIRNFAAKAESLAWPMRAMKELLGEEDLVLELVEWLSKWDTDYAKFIDPKVQLLTALQDYKHEKIFEAVAPFLDDANETARYHAAATILAQENAAAIEPLLDLFAGEESVRIRSRIADGFIQRGWVVPNERLDLIRKSLPEDFNLNGEGRFTRR